MRNAVVSLKAFGCYCDTLARATWTRKGIGVFGLVRYPFLILKASLLTLLGISFFGKRVQLFMSAYAWFRRVDDVIDGDAPVPRGHSLKSYMAARQSAIRMMRTTDDEKDFVSEDIVLLHLKRESEKMGIRILDEVEALWCVLYWSYENKMSGRLVEYRELKMFAQMQDRGFFFFCGKVFGCDRQRLEDVCDILDGIFTKIGWLRDIDHDLKKGIAAIPIDAFGMSTAALVQRARGKGFAEIQRDPSVSLWCHKEAQALFLKWKSVKVKLGNDFGGIFLHKRFARFVQKMIDRLIAKAFDEIAEQQMSCVNIENPFVYTLR